MKAFILEQKFPVKYVIGIFPSKEKAVENIECEECKKYWNKDTWAFKHGKSCMTVIVESEFYNGD